MKRLIYEEHNITKKGFFCETNSCRFGLWRDNKFLTAKKIPMTRKTAATLLKNGRIPIKGIYSEKTGKSYVSKCKLQVALFGKQYSIQ